MPTQVFDPERFLEVAERMAAPTDEANGRTAISRAYYGAFLLARDMADIKDMTARAHAETRRHYAECGEKEVAEDLQSLRTARNLADYRTDLRVTHLVCDEAVKTSRRVRSALKRIAGRIKYQAEWTADP